MQEIRWQIHWRSKKWIQDLFPTVEIKDADYGDLQRQIEESIKYKSLQTVPEFITKVIQLFDTLENKKYDIFFSFFQEEFDKILNFSFWNRWRIF